MERVVFGQRPSFFVPRGLFVGFGGGPWVKRAVFGQCPFTFNTTVIRGLREWPMGEKSRLRKTSLRVQHHGDSWIKRMAHGWKESSSDNALSFPVHGGYLWESGCGSWVKRAVFGQRPIIICATGDICRNRGVAHERKEPSSGNAPSRSTPR